MPQKQPPVPPERQESLRRQLAGLLEDGPLTALEISGALSIPEREVYSHLEHLQRSLRGAAKELAVHPARCNRCGFVFSKRERLKKPSRCPACREQSISPPQFELA